MRCRTSRITRSTARSSSIGRTPIFSTARSSAARATCTTSCSEIEQRNLPLELALLPVVESAFNPVAYSRSRASGLWQFIPSSGKHYGLEQNWWIDERRDVIEATGAALTYLQYLNKYFAGDWYLAIAAYNGGEGTVSGAVRRNQSAGLPTDFFSLNLRAETRDYVPKLLAISRIVRNPEAYGLSVRCDPEPAVLRSRRTGPAGAPRPGGRSSPASRAKTCSR